MQARGLRDMQRIHNARGRVIKQLQKESAAKRAEVKMGVRADVMSQPIYRAWQFLSGKMTADDQIDPGTPPKSDPNVLDETIDSLFAAIASVTRAHLRTDAGPTAQWREISQNFGWLLLGTACAAVLLNAGPIAANILASESDADAVTRFGYGVLLARVPLFMFQAIQASLLPRLARLAAQQSFDEFRRGLRLLIAVVAGVGVIGTIVAGALGPWVLELVYRAELSGRTLAMLALSSALYMMAIAISQAVLALEDHAYVALGWVIAILAFIVGTWFSSTELFRRIEFGLVFSSFAATVVFALRLRQRLSRLA